MRIFKYWIEHSKTLNIDGLKQVSKAFGGSNISESDAKKDAEKKLDRTQKIINGELRKDEDYEADIIEEIIEKIDDNNIVTRNRYGALVLNSKSLMFIDIDDYSKSLFDLLFRKEKSQKELMLRKIEKIIQKKSHSDFGFRIYETHKGFRVLVTNKSFDPRSKASKRIMSDFNSDYLYRWLCIKQNCYRARLTPKPHRIKQKRIKVIYPQRSKSEQDLLTNWLKSYESKSQAFSTCRLVNSFGMHRLSRVIEFHDKLTGVKTDKPLA